MEGLSLIFALNSLNFSLTSVPKMQYCSPEWSQDKSQKMELETGVDEISLVARVGSSHVNNRVVRL